MEDNTFDLPWKVGKKYKGYCITKGYSEFTALCVRIANTGVLGPAPVFKIKETECCGDSFVMDEDKILVDCPKINILGMVTIDEAE